MALSSPTGCWLTSLPPDPQIFFVDPDPPAIHSMLMTSIYHIRSSASSSSKTHKLVLTTTSLRNVVLANASDVLYYEVVTPAWERHCTRVTRLDVRTQEFTLVAEVLNGHAPGDTRGREDEAKCAMALRMYGGGEYKAVHDFLHLQEGHEMGLSVEDRKGKTTDDGEEMSDVWLSPVGSRMLMRPQRQAWFRGKDGRKYMWYADKKRLEVRRSLFKSLEIVLWS